MLFATQTQRPVMVFGLPQGVKLLCEAGYPALDLSLNIDKFEELPSKKDQEEAKEIAKSFGVVFRQAHAPFGYQKFIRVFQAEFWRIFEVVSNFGVQQMIVHPLQPGRYYGHEKEIFDLNVEFYRSLIPLVIKRAKTFPICQTFLDDLILSAICAETVHKSRHFHYPC